MRVLITGAGGQLGRELERAAPPQIEVVALASEALDIRHPAEVEAAVERHAPDLLLNTAAYTAVDRAEEEPEIAFAVNGEGVAHLASAVREVGGRMLHLSTDFVFDGRAERPYRPDDAPRPLSVYGRSKLAGERHVLDILDGHALILRTSWLYSRFGGNFVVNMLGLMRERDSLGVVDDQRGSPTWAAGLADVLWRFVARPDLAGVWHWCDAGVCSWHELARAIQEEALERRLLERSIPLEPLTTEEFGAPAPRPAYSALDVTATAAALAVEPTPWRTALGRMLDEMASGEKDG